MELACYTCHELAIRHECLEETVSEKLYLTSEEISTYTIQLAQKKSSCSKRTLFILGILAGAFIAFASQGSTMAAFNLLLRQETYGLGRVLAGAIFGTGLMLVVIAGGELFTGNTMMLAALFDGKIGLKAMLRNWSIVYVGNLVGSVFVAYMVYASGLLNSGAMDLGALTIKIAVSKVSLSFSQAFWLGLMCNWLVCLAVWMSYGAMDISGKVLAVFFPIWLFITSGFEHSIANMYYIPAGIMAKMNPSWLESALAHGVTAESLGRLSLKGFVVSNLIPVTLGNIVGGGVCVATAYWYVHIKSRSINKTTSDSLIDQRVKTVHKSIV
jgi:formate/nitrite transporter